jgi:hypothetical protein
MLPIRPIYAILNAFRNHSQIGNCPDFDMLGSLPEVGILGGGKEKV